ncbi:hypothetical protein B7H23_04215 [Notoacmeibacter marinus]|uniref:TRAP C4-dicarboxylate transport system permease DctM subunit domain-containing protein n=1 Tax=Notoacmeibacter marinus TaxID=1876515 RepID=A0A231V1Q7_9HYPH|nr:TRAP transporter fused permease subunit [Notoacmeibacter marinus]OXT02135.1 hypothetical protein B7H23_04215 [Notoacmeibacter marinus]
MNAIKPEGFDARTLGCAAVSLLHLWLNLFAVPPLQQLAALHFAALALVLLLVARPKTRWAWLVVSLVTLAPALAALVLVARQSAFYARGMNFDTWELVCVGLVILGGIEFARRSGPIVAVVIALFLSYALFWGKFIDGPLGFPGLSIETVLFRSVYTDEGMFGSIAGISASFVFMFVLFGAFLMRSGAGEFIVDIAKVTSRRMVGGPGFVAIGASALTGTVSGSAVANTVSTGVVTIPLMKRSGFSPQFAAAVEASASTGGQLMPPVMGAGAFLIASYTQTSYANIVLLSLVPALLFFLSLALNVRIEAKRIGLETGEDVLQDEQNAWDIVRKRGVSFLIPVCGVVVMLALGYTPVYAAGLAIGLVIATSWLTDRPMGPRRILLALSEGSRNAALTGLLLVAIGLVVNVIAMTGLGATFSLLVVDWAGGNLLLALLLIAIASLVLGMGLPVTAAYVVLATLSAPALAQIVSLEAIIQPLATGDISDALQPVLLLLDPQSASIGKGEAAARVFLNELPQESRALLVDQAVDPATMAAILVAANLAIFWLSQDSNVTPPVCLTAYAAAAIANSPPLRTGMIAWRIAKSIYVLPIAFFTTPILSGELIGALTGGAITLISLAALSVSVEGFFEREVPFVLRPLLGIAGLACLLGDDPLWRSGAMILAITILAWLVASAVRRRPNAFPPTPQELQ